MDVNQAIQKLLLLEDSVIVPGLGGFVSRYHPARFDAASGMFHPPVKEIVFDPDRVENDGMLVRYLSEHAPFSNEEARTRIDRFVDNVKLNLGSNRKAGLGNLGYFVKDDGNRLAFRAEPGSNLYAGAFGLVPVHLPGRIRSSRETLVRQLVPRSEESQVPVTLLNGGRSRSGSTRMLRRIAIAMPLLIVFSLLPYNARMTDSLSTSSASMVPEPSLLRLNYPDTTDSLPRSIEFPIQDSGALPGEADSAMEIKSTVSEEKAEAVRFPVIAGCFRIRENAERLQEKLAGKGYPSAILVTHSGLHKVIIQSFDTRHQAIKGLSRLRKAEPGMQLWADVK
jgi:hypothetical protein